jgi:hypothetical protein
VPANYFDFAKFTFVFQPILNAMYLSLDPPQKADYFILVSGSKWVMSLSKKDNRLTAGLVITPLK